MGAAGSFPCRKTSSAGAVGVSGAAGALPPGAEEGGRLVGAPSAVQGDMGSREDPVLTPELHPIPD